MKKFARSINGYNIYEVNKFVDDCVEQVDEMINKMKSKDLEIERLNKELEHYKHSPNTSSIYESDIIINEAKKNANRIINDALIKAEKIEEESQRMRRNIITYKRRMKNLIEEQNQIIDDLDKVDLQDTIL